MRPKNRIFQASRIAATCTIALLLSTLRATPIPQTQPGTAETHDLVLLLDPQQCRVHFAVDTSLHAVHGTFNLKSGTVHFNPENGKAGGEITVLASSGDSGNTSRDARMHKEILETGKFPDAVFRPLQVEGKVARAGPSDVKLRGIILLHGQEHEIAVQVHAELVAERWTGTAKFDVPYVQWGIKDPSNWLLKVKPVVNVELDMAGRANAAN
jgi:polyisoprenoid-binding protein YceI